MFQTLHATSQDGSSLELVAATADSECNIQDARGRGLFPTEEQISLNRLQGRFSLVVAMSVVHMCVCPLQMQFILRAPNGPQIT